MQNAPIQIGPNKPNGSILKTPLINFIQTCTDYVYDLPPLGRYCVWRYTIGSASVNKKLIFGETPENGAYWTYLFFKYANNNGLGDKKLNGTDLGPFRKYLILFQDPESFKKYSLVDQIKIAGVIIDIYVEVLRTIILNAPSVPVGGFDVYKVSSNYPGLPSISPSAFKRTFVEQQPFNSTTVSPNFNFAPFMSLTDQSILFTIFIPAGSRVLWVPSEMHAYAWENEIILPPGCAFDIYRVEMGELDYIDKDSVHVVDVQEKGDNRVIGNVYDIDRYKPCIYSGGCIINKKMMPVFRCVYDSPE